MIYLVSSFNRSGSSMMMRCLIAGGMPAVWDNSQDILNVIYGCGEYLPNPNGFYALEDGEFNRPDFIEEYNGKLVKVPFNRLLKLPKHAYKLVFLQRAPAEIRASMAKFISGRTWGTNEAITYLYAPILTALKNGLTARGDMDITVLKYADVISQPLVEFTKLVSKGWMIDPNKCASMVEDALYRNRLERA